jgi:hypothetical protein
MKFKIFLKNKGNMTTENTEIDRDGWCNIRNNSTEEVVADELSVEENCRKT